MHKVIVSPAVRLLPLLLIVATLVALPATIPTARAQAPTPYAALVGRAVLPADTFAAGPPSGFAVTGNTNGRRVPFASQPVQGFSAVLPLWNGHVLALSDNGFGAKGNSADYRLRWYELAPNFASGAVAVVGYTELRDPDQRIPFPIVNGAGDRVLTGADFDPESFRQAPDGSFWVGEELGPFLLHLDATGRLLEAPIPTPVPVALQPFARGLDTVTSPDHPDFVSLPSADARRAAANLPSSRGFEGMALNTSGTKLYPLLEGPLVDDPVRTRLPLQEFDLATKRYTGKLWFYPLEAPSNSIGDMTAINDTEYLVIERDQGEGASAQLKRIYKVNLDKVAEGGMLQKELLVDLLQIDDPTGITSAEPGAIGLGTVFKFPFLTIESVYPVDERTLLVIDDNNYPFSSGRRPGLAPDDDEIILLRLPKALNLE
ncbi:MAG: esterase-like activity of phytase family protein [Chloroflexales bacterium]|nr:esterase-like activity of phytase family protein [Chloroflexales bacterium]